MIGAKGLFLVGALAFWLPEIVLYASNSCALLSWPRAMHTIRALGCFTIQTEGYDLPV